MKRVADLPKHWEYNGGAMIRLAYRSRYFSHLEKSVARAEFSRCFPATRGKKLYFFFFLWTRDDVDTHTLTSRSTVRVTIIVEIDGNWEFRVQRDLRNISDWLVRTRQRGIVQRERKREMKRSWKEGKKIEQRRLGFVSLRVASVAESSRCYN